MTKFSFSFGNQITEIRIKNSKFYPLHQQIPISWYLYEVFRSLRIILWHYTVITQEAITDLMIRYHWLLIITVCIILAVKHPYGISVRGDYVYWTDWELKSLFRANKTTGESPEKLHTHIGGLMDVKALPVSYILHSCSCKL